METKLGGEWASIAEILGKRGSLKRKSGHYTQPPAQHLPFMDETQWKAEINENSVYAFHALRRMTRILKSQREDRSLDLAKFRFSVNNYVLLIFMTRINHISMAKLFQRR